MIKYRRANSKDAKKIALLHTESWQQNYADILTKDYLQNHLKEDRLGMWARRFSSHNPKQFVLLAEDGSDLSGFVCIYLDEDVHFGALVDNLHVTSQQKGRGIGKNLIKQSAEWVYRQRPESKMYLWVYEKNLAAINVYEHWGAVQQERKLYNNPDGSTAFILKYVWSDLRVFFGYTVDGRRWTVS